VKFGGVRNAGDVFENDDGGDCCCSFDDGGWFVLL
jgi:hypothetical protein